MANAKGFTTLRIGEEEYRLRLGFSEIADADEYLGKSVLQAIQDDPKNFHLARVLFYFAAREGTKIRGVKEAGRILGNAKPDEIEEALLGALMASGAAEEEEESGEE